MHVPAVQLESVPGISKRIESLSVSKVDVFGQGAVRLEIRQQTVVIVRRIVDGEDRGTSLDARCSVGERGESGCHDDYSRM